MRKSEDSIGVEEFIEYDFTKSAAEAAQEVDCYVIKPSENQLFIDIDTEKQYETFIKRWGELINMRYLGSELGMKSTYKITKSKSGGRHKHIICTLYDIYGERFLITESQRIMLQFALGSDPVREILSCYRWMCRVESPTRLFEPVQEGDKVCSVCRSIMFETDSGLVCENGHGGAEE